MDKAGITDYRWQADCKRAWHENNCRGIVIAATGTGKTHLALSAAKELHNETGGNLLLRIVVPQTAIALQWKDSLRKAGFDAADIGLCFSGLKPHPAAKVIVYVVNSARDALAGNVVSMMQEGRPVLIIADEYHHYASRANSRIFDFTESPHYRRDLLFSMGLSATEVTSEPPSKMQEVLGNIIYKYSVPDAVEDMVISRFGIYNISISLSGGEMDEYAELCDKITLAMQYMYKNYESIMKRPDIPITEKIRLIERMNLPGQDSRVEGFKMMILRRRAIIKNADQRLRCIDCLMNRVDAGKKIMVFSEFIDQADEIFLLLNDRYPGCVGLYHSCLPDEVRKATLHNFRIGNYRVLIACKALDEGLDVPNAEVGIFLSNTESERQRIQRLGRVIRKHEGKSLAELYYIHAEATIESSEFLVDYPDMTTVMHARFEGGTFNCPDYDSLCEEVLESLKGKASSSQFAALEKAMERGLMRFDFALDRKIIVRNICNSTSAGMRNYWIVMQQIGKVFERKLKDS